MIHVIPDLPSNIVGFKATGNIHSDDFSKTIFPAVKELVNNTGELNYLLVLDTSLSNFSVGSWLQDAMLGLKHFFKWHRAAIVSDSESIRKFTDLFGKVMPGEFKGFSHDQLEEAIGWTAGLRRQSS
jgi:hypothetical protein